MIRRTACLVALGALPAAPAAAAIDLDTIRAAKRVHAVRTTEPVRLDGLLEEAAWQTAEPALDFYQQQPAEGEFATRRSEVRFLYDAETLYVGAMLYDDEPQRAITNDLKRDFSGRDGDSFGLVLDTFEDRRNAYGFLTNPGGAQRETQAQDSGRRNDASWHGVWFARTAMHPDGWSLEFAIPFKTLRFPERDAQQWGLNMVRVVRRENEVTTWSPVPRQFTHYHVGYAGTLLGIEGVQPGRNLQLKPFVTAQVDRGRLRDAGWDHAADAGADLKWGISSSLVLDATYRTDFSQIEADEQQINLTRFSLFFPEKREFFLESQARFQIGLVDSENQPARRDLVPFFSRNIGLSAGGQPLPVLGGLRLTGRAGRQAVGLLNMQTEATALRPADNFSALRVTRELAAGTTLGAFYFGRESSGVDAYNRVAGLDLRLAPHRALEIDAFAMRSTTKGATGDWAGRAGLRLDTNAHRGRFGLVHVGESFRHDLGFVRRRGIGTLFGRYSRILRPRATDGWVREHALGANLELTADDRYRQALTRVGGLSYELLFADGGELRLLLNSTFERLPAPFMIRPGLVVEAGEHRFEDARLEYESDRSNRISGTAELGAGEFWTGDQKVLNGGLRFRLSAHVAASASFGETRIELPQGSFTGTLARMRLDWSFTPRVFLNAYVQYNGDTKTWLSNVRFNVIHRPLSDIYVVWNETRSPGTRLRAVMFKYTHLFAF